MEKKVVTRDDSSFSFDMNEDEFFNFLDKNPIDKFFVLRLIIEKCKGRGNGHMQKKFAVIPRNIKLTHIDK